MDPLKITSDMHDAINARDWDTAKELNSKLDDLKASGVTLPSEAVFAQKRFKERLYADASPHWYTR